MRENYEKSEKQKQQAETHIDKFRDKEKIASQEKKKLHFKNPHLAILLK